MNDDESMTFSDYSWCLGREGEGVVIRHCALPSPPTLR